MAEKPDIRSMSREEGRRHIILGYRRQIGRIEALLRDEDAFNTVLIARGESREPMDRELVALLAEQDRGLAEFISQHGDADVRDDTIYHKWRLIRNDGATSPLCADRPRAVDLDIEACVYSTEHVTCPACIERLKDQPA